MVPREDKWVRFFNVPETRKHNKGFTIYKIVSMLYPKDCPDSITNVTVWKRFKDIKKIHTDIKRQCKTLKIKRCPNLPNSTFFKRFDETIIKERQAGIVDFLEFVANHPALFSWDVFVNFLKTSHTPEELLHGNINSIKAKLKLPPENDYDILYRNSEDEEDTVSDTDSISTFSSHMESLPDPLNHIGQVQLHCSRKYEDCECTSHDSLSVSTGNGTCPSENQNFSSLSETNGSISINNFTCYILHASQYINEALDFEMEQKYEEAFLNYQTGVDVLLTNMEREKDIDRKEMVRRKTEKYLLRKEKIYNLYLSPESKALSQYKKKSEEIEKPTPTLPLHYDLYKYKIMKIIGSGMLVRHTELQQQYYIKVIRKSANFPTNLPLPKNVPYMINLVKYFNCENALFLVLDYCSGVRLTDYIQQKLKDSKQDKIRQESPLNSDNESEDEGDYMDLVNQYAATRTEKLLSLAELQSNPIFGSPPHDTKLPDVKTEEGDILHSSKEAKRKISVLSELSSVVDDFDEANVFPLEKVVKWSSQLLIALEKLHEANVICCDLATRNILIDENDNFVLTYFYKLVDMHSVPFTRDKTEAYAPEFCTFEPITATVDWWCFGLVLYELLVGVPLHRAHPEGMLNCNNLKIPRYVSLEATSLLKQLLVCEPRERLGCGPNGIEDIKSHPFFNETSWQSLAS